MRKRRRRRRRAFLPIFIAVLAIILLLGLAVYITFFAPGISEVAQNGAESVISNSALEESGFSEEDLGKIQQGINSWAENFLVPDDTIEESQQTTIDYALYNSIQSSDERERVREDREEFYKDHEVSVETVETSIDKAYASQEENIQKGRVECSVSVKGTRDGEGFQRIYSLTLGINYGDIVSVYEINKISWK